MTKLEQKLIELGYKQYHDYYIKRINGYDIWVEPYNSPFNKIHKMYVYNHNNYIKGQEQIDNLQQAFNEMQKDLGILKECEQ